MGMFVSTADSALWNLFAEVIGSRIRYRTDLSGYTVIMTKRFSGNLYCRLFSMTDEEGADNEQRNPF